MEEHQPQLVEGELEKTKQQLQDTQQYVKEIQLHYSIDALILAGLVAVVFQTFSYLLYGAIISEMDKILYMFSLLIGPSALFLLLLHLYEVYGIVKRGEKSIPLTLNLMYFLYIAVAFATMVGLHDYYQRHGIPSNVFTLGWTIAVTVLCVEIVIALLLAKYLVTIFIAKRLPHFFASPLPKRRTRHLPVERHIVKPKPVYYFKRKPDVSLWEHHPCFVKTK